MTTERRSSKKKSSIALGIATASIALLALACASTPNANPPTSAQPVSTTPAVTATASVASTTAAPATSTPTATAAVSPSSQTGACDAVLTAADLGTSVPIIGTTTRTVNAADMQPGFVAGQGVDFTAFNLDKVGSTIACFDSAAGAAAQFEAWGPTTGGCIDANLSAIDAQDVPLGETIGEASKGRFCPGSTTGSTTVSSSFSVYVHSGTTVFSISYSSKSATGPTSTVQALLVAAAKALLARL